MESKNDGSFTPIETLLKNMTHLEQYVKRVVNYTSRFNISNSYSYAPVNVVGKYAKYPSYGDFPEAYFLRSYGHWWKQSEAFQHDYMPQDYDPLGAEDYITLEFGSEVIPRDICIYEIYNPGAIVRIWGKFRTDNPWVLLWEGEPQMCPETSRKFHPTIRKVNCLVQIVRLEFNQSQLKYHTSIDAVLLAGCQPATDLQYGLIMKGVLDTVCQSNERRAVACKQICDNSDRDASDVFTRLPYEVILHIFQYLDLKSLCRSALVNKRWYEAANDSVLYQNISLKRYWHLVNCDTLNYFSRKSHVLKKLDLSWCGNDIMGFNDKVKIILEKNSKTLTHLSMCNCSVPNDLLDVIAGCAELTDLRLKNTADWGDSSLDRLHKLVALDLTATNIHDGDLIKIFKANPKLKHIILDLCEHLTALDQVVEVAVSYCGDLTTWSSWKTVSLTSEGARLFGNCLKLKELDLGWCLINIDPGDCLQQIAETCKVLKRLIISEWRGVNDYLLMPIIMNCKNLTQLDLLGMKNISADVCEKALVLLPRLRLLEISFCDSIRQDEVEIWRQQYPHITIQRSCQYVVTDYLN